MNAFASDLNSLPKSECRRRCTFVDSVASSARSSNLRAAFDSDLYGESDRRRRGIIKLVRGCNRIDSGVVIGKVNVIAVVSTGIIGRDRLEAIILNKL